MHTKEKILFALYVILIAYLLFNTGMVSDDFDAMSRIRGKSFIDILIPKGISYFIETPIEYFSHYIWYYFFSVDSAVVVSLFKIFYIILSFYLISKFFQLYLSNLEAFLASFLFIFFPTHDAATYWFMGQYLILSFAFYLYAFYLAHHNRLLSAFLFALLASFISYSSPIIALALFMLSLLNRKFKRGLVLLTPNIVYSAYYLFLSRIKGIGIDKISKELDIYLIVKQYILQILTFMDSALGPSMWLKVYYSFFQMRTISILIGIGLTVIFYKLYAKRQSRYDKKLVLSLATLVSISFLILAITGMYPQITFNLGNRIAIFGSVLLTYLIILMPASGRVRTLLFALTIFTILGISDHWKKWSAHQQEVIASVRANQDLRAYKDSKPIYVSGNQYSKYGKISHIEFLSEDFVSDTLFDLLMGHKITVLPINKRHKYADGYLIDTKYNRKDAVGGYIYLYDSEKDAFFKLEAEKINSYVDSLDPNDRHWVQIVNVKFVRNVILNLAPRLRYAL